MDVLPEGVDFSVIVFVVLTLLPLGFLVVVNGEVTVLTTGTVTVLPDGLVMTDVQDIILGVVDGPVFEDVETVGVGGPVFEEVETVGVGPPVFEEV